jgi:hypothetical protein
VEIKDWFRRILVGASLLLIVGCVSDAPPQAPLYVISSREDICGIFSNLYSVAGTLTRDGFLYSQIAKDKNYICNGQGNLVEDISYCWWINYVSNPEGLYPEKCCREVDSYKKNLVVRCYKDR